MKILPVQFDNHEIRRLYDEKSPIKLWLAKVGYERMQEMSDPARALDRVVANEIQQRFIEQFNAT